MSLLLWTVLQWTLGCDPLRPCSSLDIYPGVGFQGYLVALLFVFLRNLYTALHSGYFTTISLTRSFANSFLLSLIFEWWARYLGCFVLAEFWDSQESSLVHGKTPYDLGFWGSTSWYFYLWSWPEFNIYSNFRTSSLSCVNTIFLQGTMASACVPFLS